MRRTLAELRQPRRRAIKQEVEVEITLVKIKNLQPSEVVNALACRSRSSSPVEASFTHSLNNLNLDEETDFEFPMLTDEDIDCIVQDISNTGGASLGSIDKSSSIDAIHKHVEESLLFLDEEKSTLDKSENTTVVSHSKINKILEKPTDDKVMQDVDDSLRNIEMDAFDKNTEPLKNFSGILKQDNKNDASLFDKQQNDKSEIENVTTENEVNNLLECVKEEASNIPEQMESNDDILSLEDNPMSDRVLNEIDKDSSINAPQEETSGISEQTDAVKIGVSQEHPSSDCAVNEIDTETGVNIFLDQKIEIPLLTDSKKANIVSLEHNITSESVVNEINKDKNMDHLQEVTLDITDQIDSNKVIVFQAENPPSDSVVRETDTDVVANISLGQKNKIPLPTLSKAANIVSLEHNPTTDNVLNELNKDTVMDDSQEVTSDITEQIDTNNVIVSQRDNPPSTFAVHETDTNAVENIFQGQKSEIPLLTVSKIANNVSLEQNTTSDSELNEMNKDTDNPQEVTSDITEEIVTSKVIVSHEDNPPSDSTVHDTDIDAMANVSLRQKSETPLLTNDKKASIVSLEDNPSSDTVLNVIITDVMNNDSENKPNQLSRQSEDNQVHSVLQEDNILSLSRRNETDTDATIYDSELKLSDILEQSAAIKVCNASYEDNQSSDNMLNETDPNQEIVNVQKETSDTSIVLQKGISRSDLLDETDADVTMNYDLQEKFGDDSMLMIPNEISNVSKEQETPSDSLLHMTDLDANMDDTQEGISEISQQNDEMDSSNVSQEKNGSSEGVLDETGAEAAINCPQEETSDFSEQIDSNEISNISQEFNNVLSDTDAAMNVSQEIPEQIEIKKDASIYQYKVLNETDTDMTSNDSQEEINDISELIDSKEVSMVSQEDLPSDSVLNKTDIDETINASQEEINELKTYNIEDSISEKDDGAWNSELDKTDAILHEECETENKIIEASDNCQNNLESIKKDDHDNSVTEPQKERILVESKEINNQTDEPQQVIESTATEDKKYDKLPDLENNVEKTVLPINETQGKKEINETGQSTQKPPVKELVWEIKSIIEAEQQEKKELLQKERSHEQNATENPIKKNPLVRAVPLEDVTDCPPAKRPRFQPVWTTNPLNEEDKPKADQGTSSDKTAMDFNTDSDTKREAAPQHPYYEISHLATKELATWLSKNRLVGHAKPKFMLKVAKCARRNRAVLRMTPIPKEFKMMDVFRLIRNQTEAYEKEITKNIQYIHIHEYDDNFNAAYIKWRDIDKFLVVKAYQILNLKPHIESLTVDGVVIQTFYDDRSVIDWNEKERPMLRQKDGTLVIPKSASTTAVTPVVTPTPTNVATTEAKAVAATVANPVADTVATPCPRKPPPPPFKNGEILVKDRLSYGLSPAFMEYYNFKSPIASFVFVNNLDMSHTVDKYYRIFSAAGDIVETEVIAPSNQDEKLSLKLRITYNHPLEAVQAISMFHEQTLYGRVIEVVMGKLSMKKKPFVIEGFSSVGPGLGLKGFVMRDVRSSLELIKLKASTKVQLDTLKGQIATLKQTLSATTFKVEQAKRDEEKRKFKEEKKQINFQNKQANRDAVSAITKAIASSVQANVISMLTIQANQQGQNIKQTPSAPVNNEPGGMPQNQNISRAPLNWTTNENARALPNTAKSLPNTARALPNTAAALPNTATALPTATAFPNTAPAFPNTGTAFPNTAPAFPNTGTALPNTAGAFSNTGTALPNTATELPNPNMHGQTSIENAFQNLGRDLQGYQNPQDPYSYYASMQQAYAQYYNMDPTMVQTYSYAQTGTYMQPAFSNVQPVPTVQTSNMPPTTQSFPTIVSNHPVPSKPSNPTQSKVHTESKTVFPPLPNTSKNVTVYEKAPIRFDKPLANVGNKTTATSRFDIALPKGQKTAALSKVPEIPHPIPTVSQPAVKMAFKTLKHIVPTKETKPASINIKIPSVLPETVPLVVQNPRTQEKNSVQRKLMKMVGKIPAQTWINKQIREMRKNSKSPERIRKSPEKIKSPDRTHKTLPKTIPPKAAKRLSRSPDRRSRSPIRRNSRSPIRRRSRSTERRRVSRSPKRRMSRSPIRRRSKSPIRRRSRSNERRRRSRSTDRRRLSRSPKRRMSRSPKRRMSRSPKRRFSRSPIRRKSKSPIRRRSRSPKREINRSPKRRISKSPIRRKSRSPVRRISKSPVRKISRSPARRDSRSPMRRISRSPGRKISRSSVRRDSRSPMRRISRSPVKRISKSPVRLSIPPSERKGISRSRSSELGPKPKPRPAYEPDGASRDTNLDRGDITADYNYDMKWNEMERELANTSVNFSFLPPSVTTEDLTDKMGEIGELLEVRAFGMGKALVVFKFRNDAETCIDMYNMAKVDGQTIEVRWASNDDIAG